MTINQCCCLVQWWTSPQLCAVACRSPRSSATRRQWSCVETATSGAWQLFFQPTQGRKRSGLPFHSDTPCADVLAYVEKSAMHKVFGWGMNALTIIHPLVGTWNVYLSLSINRGFLNISNMREPKAALKQQQSQNLEGHYFVGQLKPDMSKDWAVWVATFTWGNPFSSSASSDTNYCFMAFRLNWWTETLHTPSSIDIYPCSAMKHLQNPKFHESWIDCCWACAGTWMNIVILFRRFLLYVFDHPNWIVEVSQSSTPRANTKKSAFPARWIHLLPCAVRLTGPHRQYGCVRKSADRDQATTPRKTGNIYQ